MEFIEICHLILELFLKLLDTTTSLVVHLIWLNILKTNLNASENDYVSDTYLWLAASCLAWSSANKLVRHLFVLKNI